MSNDVVKGGVDDAASGLSQLPVKSIDVYLRPPCAPRVSASSVDGMLQDGTVLVPLYYLRAFRLLVR